MNPLYVKFAGGAVRALLASALVPVFNWLIARGYMGSGDVTEVLSWLVGVILVIAWSWLSKYTEQLKFLVAASSPRKVTEEEVEQHIKAASANELPLPPVTTPKDKVPIAVALLLVAALGLTGCGGVSPKVVIARSDRIAYEAVRGFQVAEGNAWHARQAWPTTQQHMDINKQVSAAYQLIIDVANVGIALPPGGKLSVSDLAILTRLSQVVSDIVALARSAPASIQQAAATARAKVGALVASVQGGAQ